MATTESTGEILVNAIYSVREFCRRSGMSAHGVKKYLPIRKLGNKRFVLGQDLFLVLADPERAKRLFTPPEWEELERQVTHARRRLVNDMAENVNLSVGPPRPREN